MNSVENFIISQTIKKVVDRISSKFIEKGNWVHQTFLLTILKKAKNISLHFNKTLFGQLSFLKKGFVK